MGNTSIFVLVLLFFLIANNVIADVYVNIPDTTAYPGDTLYVPVKVSDLTGLEVYSYQLKIKYDSTVVKAIGVDSAETLSELFDAVWINLKVAGEIAVGSYGTKVLSDTGVLIYLGFEIIGQIADSSPLNFQEFIFNAGQPLAVTKDGSVKVLHPPLSVSFDTNVTGSLQILIDGFIKNIPFDTTWAYGSTHTIGTSSPQYQTTDIRNVFNSWSDGGDTLHSVVAISDTTFTLIMNEQYLLTLNSEYGTAQGRGWYIKGTIATFSIDSLVQQNDSTRQVFHHWNGTGNSSYTGNQRTVSIMMNDPVTETAEWKCQYYLNIESLYGSPVGEGWHNQGDTVIIGIDSLVSPVEGTRYIFESWTGKGQGSYSGYKRDAKAVVLEPIIEQASWQTEHYLSIKSKPEGITDFQQSGWYKKNQTAVTDTAKQILNLAEFIYHFQNWSVDGQLVAENPTQILMDTSHTAEAFYQIDSVRVTITTNIGGGTSIYVDGVKYPVPYSKFWPFHSEHTVGIDSIQATADLKTRYLFSSWSDLGEQSHNIKADTVFRLTAFLSTQHFLLVDTHPTGLIDLSETGWYDQGDTISLSRVPEQLVAGQDTFNFKGWQLENMPVPGNPIDVIMDSFHSAIAVYKDLYFISGKITYRSGEPVANIPVDLLGAAQISVNTSVAGEYNFNSLWEESYVVTPCFNGFRFEPPYRAYASLQSSLPNQNFVAFDTLKPKINLIYPNGSEQLKSTTTDTIIWQAEDNMGIDSIVIDLTIDNGINWQKIVKLHRFEASSYVWNIPDVSSSLCKIRIRAMDFDRNHGFDVSESPFSITSSSKVADELIENLPATFEMQQNYPNPFNNSTVIRFQIPEASQVNIKIFNMLGQEIVTLVDQKLNAGYHQIKWDAKDQSGKLVSSGVYFFQLEASTKVIIRQLLYIR